MAKLLLTSTLLLALTFFALGQNNVGIGTNSPNESAKLDVESSTQGVLLTRMTSDQRIEISNPAVGLLVYDTDKKTLYMFDGQNWLPFAYATNTIDLPPTERQFDEEGLMQIGYRVAIDELGIAISNNAGKVYFILYNGGNYDDFIEITSSASNPAQEKFGNDLALNGNILVVRAPGGASDTGKVYTFENINGSWSQNQLLKQNQPIQGDGFGYSVALTEETLIVGAPFDDIFGNANEGSFFVFQRLNNEFSLLYKVFQTSGSGFSPDDYFGYDVDIDGALILVGSPGHDNNEGKVYYYRIGDVPPFQSYYNRPYSTLNVPNTYYGYSVGIDSVGAIIGMPGFGNNQGGFHIIGNFGSILYGDEAPEFQQYYISGEGGSSINNNRFYGASVAISDTYFSVGRPDKIDTLFSGSSNISKKSNVAIYDYSQISGGLSFNLVNTWESDSNNQNGMGIATSIWNGRVCVGHDEGNRFLIKDFRPF